MVAYVAYGVLLSRGWTVRGRGAAAVRRGIMCGLARRVAR